MLWDAECFQSERNLDEESDFTLFAFKTNTLYRSVYTLEYTKGLIEVWFFFFDPKIANTLYISVCLVFTKELR